MIAVQAVQPLRPGCRRLWHHVGTPWPARDDQLVCGLLESTTNAINAVSAGQQKPAGRWSRQSAGEQAAGSAAAAPTTEQLEAAERAARDLLAAVTGLPSQRVSQPSSLEVLLALVGDVGPVANRSDSEGKSVMQQPAQRSL